MNWCLGWVKKMFVPVDWPTIENIHQGCHMYLRYHFTLASFLISKFFYEGCQADVSAMKEIKNRFYHDGQ